MRLVCPNCGAQYEVDDKVIPDSGRDVQCSNCGHAWYQLPAGHPDEGEAAPDTPVEDRIAPDEPEEEAGAAGEDAPEPEPDTADEDGTGLPPAAAATAAQRPLVDDEVRGILKQEAERELAARGRDARHAPEQVETQPELGIDRGSDPDEERRRMARERMARMRGLDLDEDAPDDGEPGDGGPDDAADAATARRDLFPDIEEINSTLDSRETQPGRGEAPAETRRRGGFGRGFWLVILLAAIAAALYVFAPQIAIRLPAAEPALTVYADTVDKGRLWLEDNMQALIAKLEEMAAPEGGADTGGE